MAVLDKFYIKVDGNDVYNANGTFKSLREIHTHNSVLFPEHGLNNYIHPVIGSMGDNPNAYRQIYSNDAGKFVNDSEGINFLFDTLGDAVTPTVTGRLYKSNVDYPVMNPYMVAVFDRFSTPKTRVAISNGTYTLNRYGSSGTFKNAGIIELQGAGGGSGGTNMTDSDCAGGGGGAGGFAAIYYRIKNTSAEVTLTVQVGVGGTAGGGSGSGDGGTGGESYVQFNTPSGQYKVTACGGKGGQTRNADYTSGGNGGEVTYNSGVLATGGVGGTRSSSPTSGSVNQNQVLYNDDYIYIVLLASQGGAGGGRGDDTDGNNTGQAGAGSVEMTYNLPYTHGNIERSITLQAHAGGARGANVSQSSPGGGGASVYVDGAAGGAASTTGNPGTLGAGAGGAGCGGNAHRPGSVGGDGVIYYFN